MVSISDVMKKRLANGPNFNQKNSAGEDTTLSVSRSSQQGASFSFVSLYDSKTQNRTPSSVEVSTPSFSKDVENDDYKKAQKIYTSAVDAAREVLSCAACDRPIDYESVTDQVGKILSELVAGNDNFIHLASDSKTSGNDYLPFHFANTSIFAMAVGIDSRFNMSELRELGSAAFIHDIGLAPIQNLIYREAGLDGHEMQQIRQHPQWGLSRLKDIASVSDAVLKVAYEEHERLDGSGYPRGLGGALEMSPFSKIVSAVDVFEALTHNRPHRTRLTFHEAVKHMLNDENASKYEAGVLRSLIRRVGLYPVGSWVKLSSGEAAVVTGLNAGHSLKPKVNIIFDSNGWKLKNPKTINLIENTTVQIVKPLDNEELKSYWDQSIG